MSRSLFAFAFGAARDGGPVLVGGRVLLRVGRVVNNTLDPTPLAGMIHPRILKSLEAGDSWISLVLEPGQQPD